MIFFRVLLIFVFCVLSAYTLLVVSGHGLNLFSVFFGLFHFTFLLYFYLLVLIHHHGREQLTLTCVSYYAAHV